MSGKQYKVQVCQFPGGYSVHPSTANWLAYTLHKMKVDPRISGIGMFCENNTPITMVRNWAVKEALAGDYDYILMIDSDMGPDYEVGAVSNARPFWDTAWEFMLKRSREDAPATICAPYCGPPPVESPFLFEWKNRQSDNPNTDYKLEMIERNNAAMRAGIQEMAALPTGLILYDARVFKVMEEAGLIPWFDYEYSDKYQTKKNSTEDVFQTRNASLIGLPQYVLWDSWAIHYKPKAVQKPIPITRAQVSESMQKAMASKYESANHKVMIVSPHDPAFSQPAAPHEDAGIGFIDARDEVQALLIRPDDFPRVGGSDPTGVAPESGGRKAECPLVFPIGHTEDSPIWID